MLAGRLRLAISKARSGKLRYAKVESDGFSPPLLPITNSCAKNFREVPSRLI